MLGGMQDWELRVPRLIDHAEREHPRREIVSYWADATETRTDWAGIAAMRGNWRRRSNGGAASPVTASRRWQ